MIMETLTKSKVIFDKEKHTYTLDGKKLGGVTAIVKWMFPETYKDVPKSVLEKAAEHGTLVHSKCELYDGIGLGDDIPEVKDYIRIRDERGLKTLESEYLIDDGANISSSIDKVFEKDESGGYPLGDLKTTSEIHEDNVTLQLSIYAFLFERCNPGKKAGTLMVIWLPKPRYGSAKIMDLKRVPAEACKEIMKAYLKHEDPTPYRQKYFGGTVAEETKEVMKDCKLPDNLKDAEDEIIKIEATMKEMKDRADELKKGLLELMIANNVKKWESDKLLLTRRLDSTKESVDSAKLKKDYPDVYKECKKVTNVKGSLTIKVR